MKKGMVYFSVALILLFLTREAIGISRIWSTAWSDAQEYHNHKDDLKEYKLSKVESRDDSIYISRVYNLEIEAGSMSEKISIRMDSIQKIHCEILLQYAACHEDSVMVVERIMAPIRKNNITRWKREMKTRIEETKKMLNI